MNTIYAPKGRAAEYGALALNLYRGCSHGCTYCYAPAVQKMTREEFNKPQARPNILHAIEDVAGRYKGQNVFLCFTCDPYQPIDDEHQLTREAIKILHAADVTVRILTKGGERSTRDFDLLGPGDAYGATLTGIHGHELEFEPNAPNTIERLSCLSEAHDIGIYTWVSLEPIINPFETLALIRTSLPYVDEYKLGKWNYDPRARQIDYTDFLRQAIKMLEEHGKKYYIKQDLRQYLNHQETAR